MSKRVLFVQHDHVSPTGLVGEAFADRGYDIETFLVVPQEHFEQPNVAVQFPEFDEYDALVLMGAVWGVYADDVIGQWLLPEKAAVRGALDGGTAVLGLCFGGQLLADVVGGSVSKSPAPELGWAVVHSDDEDLVPAGPWFQYHFDRWQLPRGVRELARNASASQAFVHGRGLGVQFHPELNADMLQGWLDFGGHADVSRAGLDAERLLAHTAAIEPQARRQAAQLVNAFLDRVAVAETPAR